MTNRTREPFRDTIGREIRAIRPRFRATVTDYRDDEVLVRLEWLRDAHEIAVALNRAGYGVERLNNCTLQVARKGRAPSPPPMDRLRTLLDEHAGVPPGATKSPQSGRWSFDGVLVRDPDLIAELWRRENGR